MDVFKLVGKVVLDGNKKAEEDLKSLSKTAEDSSEELSSGFGGAINQVGKSLINVGKHVTDFGLKLAPLSGLAMGVSTVMLKSASDMTDAVAKVSTLVDTSKVNISDLTNMFMDLSDETGRSATELAEAGYQALSASVDYEHLGQFVKTATDLSKVGFTDASTAVDVLTTAINAYGLESSDADRIANMLVNTQNLGKTTVNELANSMGRVIPTASSMNVNIENLTSAYVSMTKQGINTRIATTKINSVLNELGDSSTEVANILKQKTGKSFQELMKDGKSLGDVLGIIQKESTETGVNFNELWGSTDACSGAIALLNGGVKEFNKTVKVMNKNNTVLAEGLEKLETPSEKIHKSFNRVKNTGMKLGLSLLESLLPTIDKLTSIVDKATQKFDSLDDNTKNTIASVIGFTAIISPLILIFGKLITKTGSVIKTLGKLYNVFNANPIGAVITIVGLLVTAFITLWNTSEEFRNFWIELWENIKQIVDDAVNGVIDFWNGMVDKWNSIIDGFIQTFVRLNDNIKEKMTKAHDTVKDVIEKMKNLFKFEWKLPHLKLPHITITGHFSLKPPSAPHFSISWYKKAMEVPYLFTKPTIFSSATGLKGAGESGDEIMYGKKALMEDIQNASKDPEIKTLLQAILDMIKKLDDKLYDKMIKSLESMRFEVNNREFARLVKDV